jgi:uncharacterized protein
MKRLERKQQFDTEISEGIIKPFVSSLFETIFTLVAMIINTAELSDNEKNFEFTSQPDLEEETVRLMKPVEVAGKLKKGLVQVDVSGDIKGEAEVDCTRCLASFASKLEISFKVAYVSEENYTQSEESEIRNEDLEIAIYENEEINLDELVREQILLNLPTQAFCREDCKGLCEKCGANKNVKSCDCEEKEVDPRWAALKNLKRN